MVSEYKEKFNKAMQSLAATTLDTRQGKKTERFNDMLFDLENRKASDDPVPKI